MLPLQQNFVSLPSSISPLLIPSESQLQELQQWVSNVVRERIPISSYTIDSREIIIGIDMQQPHYVYALLSHRHRRINSTICSTVKKEGGELKFLLSYLDGFQGIPQFITRKEIEQSLHEMHSDAIKEKILSIINT